MAQPGDYGLDFSWGRPGIPAMQAQGYTFVCRYLSYDDTGKTVTKKEYDSYLSAGLAVCLNWENAAGDQKRGASGGFLDGSEAFRQAKALGAPEGTVIYFSADWDVQASELPTVRAYWAAAEVEMKDFYRLGVYGGYRAVKDALALGYHGWQTYAWSGGRWTNAHLRQIQNGITVDGAKCDKNQLMRDDAGFVGGTVAITQADADLIAQTWSKSDTLPLDPNKNYSNGGALYDTAQRVIQLNTKVDALSEAVAQLSSGGGADNAPIMAALAAITAKLAEMETAQAALDARLAAAYSG